MNALLEDLQQHIIISHQEVKGLQQALVSKHPNYTSQQRAHIFAQVVHAKLDDALKPFTGESLLVLKQNLLSHTLLRGDFSVSALDVFSVYSHTPNLCLTTLEDFRLWLNQLQSYDFSMEEVKSLTGTFTESQMVSTESNASSLFYKRLFTLVSASLVLIALIMQQQRIEPVLTAAPYVASGIALSSTLPILAEETLPDNGLNERLQYQLINEKELQDWLVNRQSLLAEEPYFSTILEVSYHFNVNPLLLFAITGQEQNFVPSSHNRASEIVNNPFNLYGSWQDFNTSIEDSTSIAARTIINLGQGCPEDYDPIKWINQSYAEDPNWHKGVNYFLNVLEEIALLN